MLEGQPANQEQKKPADNFDRQKYMDLYHERLKQQSENPILPFIDEDERVNVKKNNDLDDSHEIDLDKDF